MSKKRNPLGSFSWAYDDMAPSVDTSSLFIDGIYHVETYVRPVYQKTKIEPSALAIQREQSTESKL